MSMEVKNCVWNSTNPQPLISISTVVTFNPNVCFIRGEKLKNGYGDVEPQTYDIGDGKTIVLIQFVFVLFESQNPFYLLNL